MRFLSGSVSVSRGVHRNPSVCSLKLAATFPFREDIILLRSFNFGYYYELLHAPWKGVGIAVGDD